MKGPGLALGPGKVKGEVVINGVLNNGPADLQSGVLKVGDVSNPSPHPQSQSRKSYAIHPTHYILKPEA